MTELQREAATQAIQCLDRAASALHEVVRESFPLRPADERDLLTVSAACIREAKQILDELLMHFERT
jgi:hypothetical protein